MQFAIWIPPLAACAAEFIALTLAKQCLGNQVIYIADSLYASLTRMEILGLDQTVPKKVSSNVSSPEKSSNNPSKLKRGATNLLDIVEFQELMNNGLFSDLEWLHGVFLDTMKFCNHRTTFLKPTSYTRENHFEYNESQTPVLKKEEDVVKEIKTEPVIECKCSLCESETLRVTLLHIENTVKSIELNLIDIEQRIQSHKEKYCSNWRIIDHSENINNLKVLSKTLIRDKEDLSKTTSLFHLFKNVTRTSD